MNAQDILEAMLRMFAQDLNGVETDNYRLSENEANEWLHRIANGEVTLSSYFDQEGKLSLCLRE